MTEDWITIIGGPPEYPDWLGRIGKSHYPWPQQFIDEVKLTGFSKRIPHEFGQNIVPGKSRFACAHERALVWVDAPGMTLADLALEVVWEALPESVRNEPDKFDAVKRGLLSENGQSKPALIEFLHAADDAKDLPRLQKKYGLRFETATFAYVYLTGRHFVLKPDEDELPEKYRGLGLEPVHDQYVE